MKNNTHRIGVLTIDSPYDKRTWSGINNKVLFALEDNFENIYALGPLKDFYLRKILSGLNKVIYLLTKKNYNFGHSFLLAYIYSFQVNKKLKNQHKKFDILFAIGSSPAIAFLKTSAKIIYLTDATFASMVNYYLKNLWGFSIKESNHIERRALKNCDHIIFPSEWASRETIQNYNIDPTRSKIIKFGANVNDVPKAAIKRQVGRDITFNILFVGVDWERKGGDVLLNSYFSLKKRGYNNINLTICGTIPPNNDNGAIKIFPFLDKNNVSDLKILQDIYRQSHLFILPTKAECAGIVFCEAAAYSLPIITTNTGGVNSYVQNSFNGFTFNIEDDFSVYESAIINIMEDQSLYDRLSKNSFSKYETELNWVNFGNHTRNLIENI